ncbi:aminotransferase class IV [Luteimonas sp. YGD11-2]|uniref:aminotransferase class IV n=1 Tax=Luteimonas sp. YGD11-2 TaxID=2508168 RepID=UPI00100AA47D|nr:aminotransferase class IV [Luteimonas sp. YGD11-2]
MLIFRNGHPATAADLAHPALVNDGHFTTMQVRGGAVQGLELHLQRLADAHRTLFSRDLDTARVRADCAAAITASGLADATLRVTIHPGGSHLDASGPVVLVSLAAPALPGADGLRLKSFVYVRELPGVKHVGTFPLLHYRRLACVAGCDDALFVTAGGLVCEGSFWNLALWDGRMVIWPDGPALRGTREQLLQREFRRAGVAQQVRAVALDELPGLAGICCNSRGVQPLASVDGRKLSDPAALLALAAAADVRILWDPLDTKEGGAPTVAGTASL